MNNDTNQSASSAPAAPDPNDMNTDMTDDELQSFVDNHLGNQEQTGSSQVPQETPPEPPIPPVQEPPINEPPATAPVTSEPTPPITPPVQEPELPTSVDTSDLWIETQLPDTVDANGNIVPGKTIRLGVDDDLPDDIKFRNDKHLAEIMEARKEMKEEKFRREADLESQHEEWDKKEQEAKAREANNKSIDTEIATLIDAGLLEQPKVKPGDPKFLEDPAVQKIDAVLRFMSKENADRQTAGKSLITSFGVAMSLFNKESGTTNTQQLQAAAAAKQAEDAEIKRRGTLVGGGSGAPITSKKAVYEAGSAKNIWEVPVDVD